MNPSHVSAACRYLLFALASIAPQAGAHEEVSEEIVVRGRATDLIGIEQSASSGLVGAADLAARPILRSGELLEVVPGAAVTQHSGTGKANQYFLRGFNLDHGTDFSASLDGVPLNLRTHGHGQGYLDLNPIIPELVDYIEYGKGPYEASVGDFAAAGYARYALKRHLHDGLLRVQAGEFGYYRGVTAASTAVAAGELLGAVEAQYYDGPWEVDENARKLNGLLRYTSGTLEEGFDASLTVYEARWDSTDQVPLRAVRDGRIDRLGSIDPTLGGESERYSVNLAWRGAPAPDRRWQANAYAVYSDFELYSNFTYFLDDPVRGDQIAQFDRRWLAGMNSEFTQAHELFGHAAETRVGTQVRHDGILDVALARSTARRVHAFVRSDSVDETSLGLYLATRVELAPWLRAEAALRADRYWFDVAADLAANSGAAADTQLSPKATLVFTPHAGHELYLNYGRGFHSNDARGVLTRIDPASGTPSTPVDPLVSAWGGEAGWRTTALPGLTTTVAGWYLEVDSELLFVGDAGTTEASGASRRYGVEWTNFYRPRDWLTFDLDLAFTHAEFTGVVDDAIPNAVGRVITAGVALDFPQGFFGSLRLRHFGDTPLVEDGSVEARDTTVVNLRAGYRVARGVELALEVFNLFDSGDPDISYWFASCIPGDPAAACGAAPRDGVEGVHAHPVEPRAVRGTLSWRF
ncbi:MAG: TonB-dependent receptor [Gammaproteobacteria bacterium]|nr:TonB-dependent receptor [Gammaproteobacteria bacterium]MCP5198804.1 TonB-dependent receptor [Gammaproteobacteria bacterium]